MLAMSVVTFSIKRQSRKGLRDGLQSSYTYNYTPTNQPDKNVDDLSGHSVLCSRNCTDFL